MAETLRFAPSGRVPNGALPALLHRGALQAGAGAAAHEALFARSPVPDRDPVTGEPLDLWG